ncbi:E3 ubiquitin-protein ligase XIAP [Varanus komodoensis]|uniref:E3 ubiquitin-protein ligase XIAP n=1 Tax=Varanus komodoensis TaxID=61221 RepID=A0A8D2L5V0_VARKO|nr:E3 ubiquitin-protein ligase XIAP [Varanus komodoensis]XP_044283381.1 E3 ubiquitin-protein ligase XIAP [Varanus komodoensis]
MTCNGPDNSGACPVPEADPNQDAYTRQHTFAHFPSNCPVSPATLAQAGFFYTGVGDRVECASCHANIEGWRQGDSVVGRHKTISPNCSFITDSNAGQNDMHSVFSNCHRRTENRLTGNVLHPPVDPDSDLYADYLLRTGKVVDLSDSLYPRNPAMCEEEMRLRTFHNWPSYAPVTPKELAKAGLYYTGTDDEVECFCCGGKLKNWEPCDQAWSEHRRHFPRCFFVLGHDVGNVANVPNQSGDAKLDTSEIEESIPHNPSMAFYEDRIKSFVMWRYLISKEQLARAGFYSTGNGDNVICFHCGGGLTDWQHNEDPWEQHARWFPGCKYVIEEKGVDFVNSIHLTNSLHASTVEEAEKTSPIKDEELLQKHVVQNAMRMGFSLDEIKKAVERKRHLSSESYSSVEALVADLINAQKENVLSASQEKDLSIEEKLRRLQEEKLCKVCLDKNISVALIPCGHLVVCKDCAEAIDKCPLCCRIIEKRQKIYMS